MNKLIRILGLCSMFGSTLLICYAFIMAYLSPDKAITIYVNTIGEANFEMFVFFPFVLITSFLSMLHFIKKEREEEI